MSRSLSGGATFLSSFGGSRCSRALVDPCAFLVDGNLFALIKAARIGSLPRCAHPESFAGLGPESDNVFPSQGSS